MARPADPSARDTLIAAARGEFVKHGIRGARIEDITSVARLSKGAFYLHFQSKEELFGELVEGLLAGLETYGEAREQLSAAVVTSGGELTADELRRRTPRACDFLDRELELDVATLELMWEHRDIMDVLIRGSQGTPFEGLMWQIVDRELVRLTDQISGQGGSPGEAVELPVDLLASLIVGTYLLLGKRMVSLSEKPDLRTWAAALQRLLHEGTPLPAQAAPPARSPSGRTLKAKPAARKPLRRRPSAPPAPRRPRS